MNQQHQPVGESRREPNHKSEQEREFSDANRIHDDGSKATQKVEVLINGRGVTWTHKLVDRPKHHDEKNCKAENQQRYTDAVAINKRYHSGLCIGLCKMRENKFPQRNPPALGNISPGSFLKRVAAGGKMVKAVSSRVLEVIFLVIFFRRPELARGQDHRGNRLLEFAGLHQVFF